MTHATKVPSKSAWVLITAIGVVFVATGMWLVIAPWAPPYGGKAGFVFHLAYLAVGQYGPAMVFALLGLFVLFWGLKQLRS
jgi:hypothetical protein